ncbi:MAG: hypothetical protein FJ135_16365 [Deltaproteobacteria bacterium]|nr:hypothetical protein [Deltaproteobacteria bacterium]
MGWAEALLPYRASDDPQGFLGAALLAQDQTLFRLAATWPRVKKVLPPPPGPGEEIDLEKVWEQTRVDFDDWAGLAQVNCLAAISGFQVLKANGVVFPDGSLSHQAEAVLKRKAASAFMTATGIKGKDLK